MTRARQHQSQILGLCRRATTGALALAILLLLTVVLTQPAQAQTYTKLHDFTGGVDGANPQSGLVMDSSGKLYGMTMGGGTGFGSVFRLVKKGSEWVFAPLYEFTGAPDGAGSRSRVLVASDGSLYAPTGGGGMGGCNGFYPGCGTVFNLKPKPSVCKAALCFWNETQLYSFTGGSDGEYPYADLTIDSSGNLYGGTFRGGVGSGVIYELMKGTWTESVLYTFSGGDGTSPEGGVVFDKEGNLYGPTIFGGVDQCGVVFQLTPSEPEWTERILYQFQCGSDGGYPVGGLIFDSSGNLFGTTSGAGPRGGGTVFELTPSGGNWQLHTLCSLPGSNNNTGGSQASLVMDGAGNLYGTTLSGGAYQYGSVFKATFSGGNCISLYDFTGGDDGGYPWDGLARDANGNLYGTASVGGTNNMGVVFEITP